MKKQRFLLALLFSVIIFFPALAMAASFNYTPMEQIPGFSTSGDFCGYISSVYKFGIWTVGIAAMLMIIIGGYMYVMSAGNNASMGKAKSIITDAILGLVLALTSYLLLYEINPNLLNCKISGGGAIGGGAPQAAAPAAPATGASTCAKMQSQVPSQCGDASPALQGVLSCMGDKLGSTAQISSISDGNGGIDCYSKYSVKCGYEGQKNCCYHARTSCHYGNKCMDGSHAVDFSTNSTASLDTMEAAAKSCGATYTTQHDGTAFHLHASIGAGCGCN